MFDKLPTDKFYKFSCLLGLTCLVTLYLVQEDKREKVHQIHESIFQKQDSLLNFLTKENYIANANIVVKEHHRIEDSIKFETIRNSRNLIEIEKKLKSTKLTLTNFQASSDSTIKARAFRDAYIAGVQNEIKTLTQIEKYRQAQLDEWGLIANLLAIIGGIFFLYGLFAWFLADLQENIKK